MSAAITQGLKGERAPWRKRSNKQCYGCGQGGHCRRGCPKGAAPGRCPRCGKENHWVSECQLIRDTAGNLLHPKNGAWGPKPWGPQIYRVFQWPIQVVPRTHYPLTPGLKNKRKYGIGLLCLRHSTINSRDGSSTHPTVAWDLVPPGKVGLVLWCSLSMLKGLHIIAEVISKVI